MKSPNLPKAASSWQRISWLNRLPDQSRKVLLTGLIVFFLLAAATTLLLAYYIYQPQIGALFATPTPTLTPTPTPLCVRPTLSLGTSTYPLQVLTQDNPDTLPTPPQLIGAAWWVSNTFNPFVFILKPGIGAPDLQTALQLRDPMVVQWADCGREEFVLTEIQAGRPDASTLLSQTYPGIAILVHPQGNVPDYVIHGQRPELVNPPTPEPTQENGILVDMAFGETLISIDEQTLQTSLTLTNHALNPLSITYNDLSLTAEGEQPLSPLSVEPSLPQEIAPEASLSLIITFTNPGGHTAVLHVLDIALDLYY